MENDHVSAKPIHKNIPFNSFDFMHNVDNKTMLLNLIEQSLIEGNDRLISKIFLF